VSLCVYVYGVRAVTSRARQDAVGARGANPLRTSISAAFSRGRVPDARPSSSPSSVSLSVDETGLDTSRLSDAATRAYVLPVFPAPRSLAEERAAMRRRESGGGGGGGAVVAEVRAAAAALCRAFS
jgi:hypothetical protein